MDGLDLVVLGAIPVDLRIPVEPFVVRLANISSRACRVVLHVGPVDRRALKQRALRRRRRRPALRLTDAVLVFLEYAAELDFVSSAGRTVSFKAGREPVSGIGDLGAGAVLVIFLRAVDRAAENIDIGIDVNTAEDRTEAARTVGAEEPVMSTPQRSPGRTTSLMSLVRNEPRRRSRRSRRYWRSGRARHRCRRPVPDRGRRSRWRCGRCADNSAARRRRRPRRGRNPAGRGC